MNATSDQLADLAGSVFETADLIAYQTGAIVSRTLIDRDAVTVTVFAVDEGQSISEHSAPHEAILHVLDGQAHVEIDGEPFDVAAGEGLVFPPEIPHSLHGDDRFKMVLIMSK